MMQKIRKAIGSELAFEKGLIQYKSKKRKLDLLQEELSFLSWQYKDTTDSFNKAIVQFPDRKDSYNNRYNSFFSGYIDEVGDIKKEIDKLTKSLEPIKASIPFFQEYLDIINRILEIGYKMKYQKYLKDGLGIARKNLPQYSYKNIDKLISKLDNENTVVNKVLLPINILKPTQKEFDHKKIHNMVENGIDDKNFIPIISKDLHILDGHHTWASLLEVDEDKIIEAWLINLSMGDLLNSINNFKELQKAAITILQLAVNQGAISQEEFSDIQKSINDKL